MTISLTSFFGYRDTQFSGQVAASQRGRVGHDLPGRTLSHNLTTMDTCPGTHVQDMVGGQNGVLVMLNHQDRVADIPQMPQGSQQPLVITLMQADGWLVEDIQNPDEA